jgi:hypothetical protein
MAGKNEEAVTREKKESALRSCCVAAIPLLDACHYLQQSSFFRAA